MDPSQSKRSSMNGPASPSTDNEASFPATSQPSQSGSHDKKGTSARWVKPNLKAKERLEQQGGDASSHPSFQTSWFPHKDEWSEENLPKILLFIKLPVSQFAGVKVRDLIRDGQPVRTSDGSKVLRDLPVLPDRISIEAPAWLLQTWRDLDPRIKLNDIIDRQHEEGEFLKLSRNTLSMRCGRDCRNVLRKWTGYGHRAVPHRVDVETIETYSTNMIRQNTILFPDHLRQDRLVKCVLTEADKSEGKGDGKFQLERVQINNTNALEVTYPLDAFLSPGDNGQKVLQDIDPSMEAAIELLWILQERARVHGLPDWSHLGSECTPSTWQDHISGRKGVAKRMAMRTSDPDGYGGCSKCKWPERTPTDEEPSLAKPSKRQKRKRRSSQSDSQPLPTSSTLPHGGFLPQSVLQPLPVTGAMLLDAASTISDPASDVQEEDADGLVYPGDDQQVPEDESERLPDSDDDLHATSQPQGLLPPLDEIPATQSSSEPVASAVQDPAADQEFLKNLDPQLLE